MAGAPAGPALDPERPADRLDAVRETDESRPVRRARRAQPPAGSARPPGASPPRPGCSPETLGSNLRATAVARTPELDRRLAVLAEDNERCWSSRAALACVVARLVDVRRELRGVAGARWPPPGPYVPLGGRHGRSSRSCRDVLPGRAQGPSARPLGRSRIVVEGSRGAGQPELMFPCLEFSDVCRCRDGGRNLPMTSRRVPDVVSPSDNARAAGRSIT
jgi:hypothetical protein